MQTFTGPEDVGGTKADDDGYRHGEQEEDQRRCPYPVHLIVSAQVGDAGDDGGEDQRHQHHAQQIKEEVADHFGAVQRVLGQRRRALGGKQAASGDAEQAADQDLGIQ